MVLVKDMATTAVADHWRSILDHPPEFILRHATLHDHDDIGVLKEDLLWLLVSMHGVLEMGGAPMHALSIGARVKPPE